MGVIDMVNGKLCETLPIEEIEQIRNESYEQGRADMQEFVEKRCKELGIDYIPIFTCNSAD